MTADQFDALAALLRMQSGAARECARLVLVEGAAQADAAGQTGLSRQAASQSVKRARSGMALARRAAGVP